MDNQDRDWWPAVLNGLRRRCPRCGMGAIYQDYMSVRETCPECGLDLSRRPGEVLPAYFVITAVGLILIGLTYLLVMILGLQPIVALLIALPLGILLPLAILPSVKGAVIGFQWAKGVQEYGDPQP